MELDFRALFADVADNLYMLWTSTYAKEVLKYASLQGKWQSYLHIDPSKMSKYTNEQINMSGADTNRK